jgi:large subunit ribosomal protein L25
VAENQLAVETREAAGKGNARKLRAAGRIPVVCYGAGLPSKSIQVDPTVLDKLLRKSSAGMNTLIDLQGGGLDGKVVMVKDLQRDPVSGRMLHADFYAIEADKAIEVEVPVHIVGTPTGVTLGGGILDFPLREIEVLCLPGAIPEELSIDVSALELGDSIHVRDIALPAGVELVSDADLTVVSVVAPAKPEEEPVAAEAAAEGEAAAEPEGEGAPEGDDKKSAGDDDKS